MPPARALKPVPDQPGRTVCYVRVSALMGRGGDDFHSPGMQLDAMRRSIGLAGLQETAVVEDIDVSGQTFSRNGIDRIKAMVEARQVDVVALYDLSRLGRNLAESLTFIAWLRERGVSVMSSQERIDDSPEGQYMLGQFLGLAELYGAQIGRRWAQIVERRARAGKHHGVAPQGYTRSDGRLIADPVLGPAVTAVFTAYADDVPVSQIMRDFAAARGRPVRRNVIKWMLNNRVYLGRVVVDTKVAGPLDLPGEHPALVDEATWERVQRRLARDRVTPPRHVEAAYSLTGLVWCAHCAGSTQVWYSDAKDNHTRRLICSRSNQSGGCKGIGTPRYADVESAVLDLVRGHAELLAGNPAAEAARIARAARAGADAASLEHELSKVRDSMGRLTERWARGGVPDSAYERAIATLEESERILADQVSRARATKDAPRASRVVALVERMGLLWPDMDQVERNQALKAVLTRVEVRKAERWREPVAERLVGATFR